MHVWHRRSYIFTQLLRICFYLLDMILAFSSYRELGGAAAQPVDSGARQLGDCCAFIPTATGLSSTAGPAHAMAPNLATSRLSICLVIRCRSFFQAVYFSLSFPFPILRCSLLQSCTGLVFVSSFMNHRWFSGPRTVEERKRGEPRWLGTFLVRNIGVGVWCSREMEKKTRGYISQVLGSSCIAGTE